MNKKEQRAAERKAYIVMVNQAISEACASAVTASAEYIATAPRHPEEGWILGPCGSAWVEVYKPSFHFRTALASIDQIRKLDSGRWEIGSFSRLAGDQCLFVQEAACRAACDVLQSKFPSEQAIAVRSWFS